MDEEIRNLNERLKATKGKLCKDLKCRIDFDVKLYSKNLLNYRETVLLEQARIILETYIHEGIKRIEDKITDYINYRFTDWDKTKEG